MAVLEIRLADADRQRWPCPEWVRYDHEQVLDTPADVLDRWEQAIGCSLDRIMQEVGEETARARRVVAWLALHQASVDVPWAKFTPRTLRMQFRVVDGDAGPPESSSSPGSGPSGEDKPTSQPGSFSPR